VSLPSGTRVGVYEILSPLGAGGMGEVYRARDTRLDRQVAVKILLESFADDPDRLGRFEREAKLLASLNHPHIAQIYGLEDRPSASAGHAEMRALVMELVEGPTLADRIAQGALPLDETVSIARQIAAALEAAHEHGIVHRDLKPANIKLRQDGAVKVLDFGLAKLADPAPGSVAASALTSPGMTRAGLVLGTPAYMSPEQARGQSVDARADLWAFGCVCYEMLTGRRAFDGDTASDAIAAVLTREPDWSALPERTPESLRRLLRRCLARDVARRQRHPGDIRIELEDIASNPSAEDPSPTHARATRPSVLPWTMALAAAVAALWLGWRAWSPTATTVTGGAGTAQVELSLPPGFELFPSNASTIIAAPDGQAVAFIGTSSGDRQLFLRRLNAFDASPVRGTLGATTATFSPDGRSLAFVTSGGELKTASLADGLVTTLTRSASLLYGVAWAANDQIVFVRAGALWTVFRSGGEPSQLTTLADDEQTHAWPSVSPDGRTLLITVETAAGSRIDAVTLEGGDRRLVLDQASRGKIGPEGRLFFYRDGRMLAMGFDAATSRAIGSPIPVVDTVPDLGSGMPVGDVSPGGLMVFPAGSAARRLVWVSRQGVETSVTETTRAYLNPRLSPDNTRIVVQVGTIWVHDLRRGAVERLATLGAAANAFPAWLPDGTTVMYRSGVGLRVQSTASSVHGRTLPGTTEFDYPSGVTPDGRMMVFNRNSPETSFDVMLAPIEDPSRATPLVQTPAYEGGASLSSDGRWLVYVSNESGRNEVYVRPLQRADRRWQVSSDGGSQPVWNPNGHEIFYRIGDRMMAVAVTVAGDELRLAAPQQLFARPYAYGAGITIANYDVTRDGQRFLMVRDDTTVGRLRVILNWRPDSPTAPEPAR
jgi:serine/threonine protein kinase/Tol biopolymer transport system component